MSIEKEFVPYQESLELKELGFDEPCLAFYNGKFIQSTEFDFDSYNSKDIGDCPLAPTFSQAINFLYICSNKQINIELKASDTYEERVRKVAQGCEDLRNLQNSKSN